MNTIIAVAAFVSLTAFASAGVLAVLKLSPGKSGRSPMPFLGLATAMALYAFVGLSNLLEYSDITSALDLWEDYAQLLFAPLLTLAAFATEAQMRLDERTSAANMHQRQHDLLMNIVNTTPVGIMIIAPGGHITFANDPARRMLRIREDVATGMFTHPEWKLTDSEGLSTTMGDLVGPDAVSGVRRILTWPDGRRQQLLFSVTPMNDATMSLGGAVVAMEAVTVL